MTRHHPQRDRMYPWMFGHRNLLCAVVDALTYIRVSPMAIDQRTSSDNMDICTSTLYHLSADNYELRFGRNVSNGHPLDWFFCSTLFKVSSFVV